MALERNATRFFAANQHIFLHHMVSNVIEAYWCFIERKTITFCQTIDHTRSRDNKILQRQRHDLMRVNERATLIHRADAVCIAIGHNAEVAHP